MAEIRINKILRQFNIGLDDLVSFLRKKGLDIDANPNAKVSDEYMPAITKQYGKDLEMKQAADKVEVKITDILEKTSKKTSKVEEDDELEHETIIRSNTLSSNIKINAEAPKTEPIETPKSPSPAVVESTPKSEGPKVETPKTETPKPEAEKLEAQPKKEEAPKTEAAPVAAVSEVPSASAEVPNTSAASSEPVVSNVQRVSIASSASNAAAATVDTNSQAASAVKTEAASQLGSADQKPAVEHQELKANAGGQAVVGTQAAQAAFGAQAAQTEKLKSDKPQAPKQDGNNQQNHKQDANKAQNPKQDAHRKDGQKPNQNNKGQNFKQGEQRNQNPKPEAPKTVEAKAEEPKNETNSLKVVGKIDLSQFDRKPKKRERINKGAQKVDVAKAGANIDKNQKKDSRPGNNNNKNSNNKNSNNNNQQQRQGEGKNKRNRDRNREQFKPVLTEAQQEEMQKEIQKQVKETYARMNEGKKNNFGAKYRKEKRDAAALRTQEEIAEVAAEKRTLKVTEFVTVNDLATLMGNTPVVKVIGACMSLGLMVSINQRLDAETLVLVAEEFGYKIEFVTADITEEISGNAVADNPEDLEARPPIITVMGHVDHGKTSLLDYIRKSNVIAGEAGGITQHIGAYNVTLSDERRITFLDTPGHEAFTAMRARGAQLTDLAIIIVAADDAVMPQTIEAINHAQAANVPMVFAINKIDKDGADSEKIRRQLSEMNILVEDWGGKYQCQEISAKKGLNVDLLLEKVLLETDLLELKANPNKPALGAVIESSLDKGRGYLATVLVQEGTLHPGDVVLCGSYYGRIKSMFNERGQKIKEAGPSTPVSILGLNGAPAAGEKFNVMLDEKEAKSIAAKREQLIRIQGIKTQKHMTLDEIGRRIAIGNFKELNLIVKGDVDGSVEALSDSLIKLSTEEVKVNVIHKAVGGISESDILLAEASDAIIVGFQVRPTVEARKVAEREGIEIRLYSVIYDCINEVKDGIEGMLEPEKKEEVIATAEVKQTFKISKVGTIAGCIMRDGKMIQKSKVRLIRDGIVIYTGELSSLQIGKDSVKEVPAGKECGMAIAGYNDIKEGDMIEAFQIVEIKRTL